MPNLADLRQEYTRQTLTPADLPANPLVQFQSWLDEALTAAVPEPTAMHLATVGADGRPASRVVLLKGLDESGFTFFTNYESRKGQQLGENPWVALTFFWPELERQVRVEGLATQAAAAVSDAYFASRPRGSQLGAWASPQSRPIVDRQVLEAAEAELAVRFGAEVPRPPALGRLHGAAGTHRILAGPSLSAARPGSIPAATRRQLAQGAAGPLD